MKVYIGDWSNSRPFYHFFEKLGFSNARNHKVHDWLKKYKLIERDRTVKIRIDSWDVWNADATMAMINAKILQKYRQSNNLGYPSYLDAADYPKDLEEFEGWLYIVDEMIYVFDNYDFLFDYDDLAGYEEARARFDNGLKLYGKYFTSIWI